MQTYTWKVFLQKLKSLCGDDFEFIPDWNNYLLELKTHLDLYGQVEELENILDYPLSALVSVNSFDERLNKPLMHNLIT